MGLRLRSGFNYNEGKFRVRRVVSYFLGYVLDFGK